MLNRRAFVGTATAITALTLSTGIAFAEDEISTGFLSNVAVNGYDTVSYFTEGEPVKGSRNHSMRWRGAVWRFDSEENLELFRADPEKYAPQYGGYCAWAVSQGYTAPGDAQVWKIHEGKLYLNYDRNVQKTWLEDIPGFIQLANAAWPSVLQ